MWSFAGILGNSEDGLNLPRFPMLRALRVMNEAERHGWGLTSAASPLVIHRFGMDSMNRDESEQVSKKLLSRGTGSFHGDRWHVLGGLVGRSGAP